MTTSIRGGAVGEWPAEELEDVETCPACGARDRHPFYDGLSDRLFDVPGLWRLMRCADCGSAYLDRRPNEVSIGRAYAAYYTHGIAPPARPGGPRKALLQAYLNAKWGYDLHPSVPLGRLIGALVPLRAAVADRELRHQRSQPGGRLLDVGAGNGAFVAYARRLGWDAEGIDPDGAAVATASDHGIPVRLGTLADLGETDAETFDAVTLSHVIEHLHDPARDLRGIRRLLAPGGRVWIATPNLASLGHRLFRADWAGLDPPRHLVLFTIESLQRLLRLTGFELEAVPRPAPTASVMFSHSGAIRDGRPPGDGPDRGARSLRVRAAAADSLAYASPRLAEEMVVIGRRGDR